MTVQELINLLQKVEDKQSNVTVERQYHYGERDVIYVVPSTCGSENTIIIYSDN